MNTKYDERIENNIWPVRRTSNIVISILESYIVFNICPQGCFSFIIQLFNRNVTYITKIINIVTIKTIRDLFRWKNRPRPQAFNINQVWGTIVMWSYINQWDCWIFFTEAYYLFQYSCRRRMIRHILYPPLYHTAKRCITQPSEW